MRCTVDSRAMLRVGIGFHFGIISWALLKCVYIGSMSLDRRKSFPSAAGNHRNPGVPAVAARFPKH